MTDFMKVADEFILGGEFKHSMHDTPGRFRWQLNCLKRRASQCGTVLRCAAPLSMHDRHPQALNPCFVGCLFGQVGYSLEGPKRAIVGAYLGSSTAVAPYVPATLRLPGGDGSPFSVLDAATGAQVFAGAARVFGDGVVHEYFKQVAYHLDFSALTTPVCAAACTGVCVCGQGAVQGERLSPEEGGQCCGQGPSGMQQLGTMSHHCLAC